MKNNIASTLGGIYIYIKSLICFAPDKKDNIKNIRRNKIIDYNSERDPNYGHSRWSANTSELNYQTNSEIIDNQNKKMYRLLKQKGEIDDFSPKLGGYRKSAYGHLTNCKTYANSYQSSSQNDSTLDFNQNNHIINESLLNDRNSKLTNRSFENRVLNTSNSWFNDSTNRDSIVSSSSFNTKQSLYSATPNSSFYTAKSILSQIIEEDDD